MIANDSYIVGVDIGTSSTKAAVFDRLGKIKGRHSVGYPLHVSALGAAEQDPDEIYAAVLESIRGAIHAAPVVPERIGAVGFGSVMHRPDRGEYRRPAADAGRIPAVWAGRIKYCGRWMGGRFTGALARPSTRCLRYASSFGCGMSGRMFSPQRVVSSASRNTFSSGCSGNGSSISRSRRPPACST